MQNESNPLYRSCRWCRWFSEKNGICTNDRVFGDGDDLDFSQFLDDGHLSEAIREGLNEKKFKRLEHALIESRISKKRIAEILESFYDELDDAFVNWTESIDDCVSSALNNFDFGYTHGVKIKEPSELYCKFLT